MFWNVVVVLDIWRISDKYAYWTKIIHIALPAAYFIEIPHLVPALMLASFAPMVWACWIERDVPYSMSLPMYSALIAVLEGTCLFSLVYDEEAFLEMFGIAGLLGLFCLMVLSTLILYQKWRID